MSLGRVKCLLLGLAFSVQCFDQVVAVKRQDSAERIESTSQSEKRQSTLRRLAKLKIDYVSPAGGVDDSFRKEYLKDIQKFGVSIPSDALINKNICRFSDTDSNRLLRLKRSINSDSKIIWAMRGGFGSYKLIDPLKNFTFPKKKKILIGFSDITALDLYVSQNCTGWTVIHAPMIVHLAKDRYHHPSWKLLLYILEHKISKYEIPGLSPLNRAGNKAVNKIKYKVGNKIDAKKICGKLTGGNLTMIETSLKTIWEINTDNKILFIEDCNESAPSIYRSMYHLKEAGKLSKVKAIVFGHFLNCPDHKKYLKHFASELNIPVFITDQFGHGKNNLPLVYNADAYIENNSLIVNLPWKKM